MIRELAEIGKKIEASPKKFDFELFHAAYQIFFQTILYECESLEQKHVRAVSSQELRQISEGNYQKTLQRIHALLPQDIRLNTTVKDLYETIAEDISLAEKIKRSCFTIEGHYSRLDDLCFIDGYLSGIDAAGVLFHETVHRYIHHKRTRLNLDTIAGNDETYCTELGESFVSFLKEEASFHPQQKLEKLKTEIVPKFMYDIFCRDHVLEIERRVICDREQSLIKLLERRGIMGCGKTTTPRS